VGDLKRRILTAAVLGPLLILLFAFLTPKLFFLFMGVVLILAVYEFTVMAQAPNRLIITVLAAITFVPLYMDNIHLYLLWLLFAPALYLVLRMMGRKENTSVNISIGKAVNVLLLSSIFLVLPFFFLYRLKEIDHLLPLVLMLTIWGSDTGAYLVGKNFGRHRIAPAISPKKTVEGLGGAIAGALVGTIIFHRWFGGGIEQAAIAGVAIGVLGQMGDILESMAKRIYSVKDSSGLIPGHGGILDRVDSFILATLFVYYCLGGLSL